VEDERILAFAPRLDEQPFMEIGRDFIENPLFSETWASRLPLTSLRQKSANSPKIRQFAER
jgi:hypothetical protein